MTDIYDQHKAAFARVEAFVIAKDGQGVATIAFKFPADGAGRLYAYVHWLGLEMVRGYAGGGGYDKRSAACRSAVDVLRSPAFHKDERHRRAYANGGPQIIEFMAALADGDKGAGWDRCLRDAGFDVWGAV